MPKNALRIYYEEEVNINRHKGNILGAYCGFGPGGPSPPPSHSWATGKGPWDLLPENKVKNNEYYVYYVQKKERLTISTAQVVVGYSAGKKQILLIRIFVAIHHQWSHNEPRTDNNFKKWSFYFCSSFFFIKADPQYELDSKQELLAGMSTILQWNLTKTSVWKLVKHRSTWMGKWPWRLPPPPNTLFLQCGPVCYYYKVTCSDLQVTCSSFILTNLVEHFITLFSNEILNISITNRSN